VTEQESRDIGSLLTHLRDREQRMESMNERIAQQLNKTAERLGEVASRVERMDARSEAYVHTLADLTAAVSGTVSEPGLATRVDRIEQAILLLRWIFGGGLVAASAAVVLLWKFGQSMAGSQ
jgi:AcrR family transcriptional regulator